MMMSSPALENRGFTQQAFDRFLSELDEPGWLIDLRRAAWQAFGDLPLPPQRPEEWTRTDIRLFHLDRFGLPVEAVDSGAASEPLLTENLHPVATSTTLNSRSLGTRLSDDLASRGVLFGSLTEMVAEHGELLRPHFERQSIDPAYDKFAALNAACFRGGTLLYVPRGVTVEAPLHALAAIADGGVDLGRTLVVLEDDAEATLVAETGSDAADAAGLHVGAIELIVGAGARLRYVNLQNWGSGTWHFAHQRALVDRDAQLQWTIAALGGRLAKVNQQVSLVGPGADVQVQGVMFTEGKQHLSYHTLQHHQAPSCRSDLLYKAALQDRSRTVWRGMIRVDHDSQKTDAYQRNDNLMLSAQARADAIPGLEIEADDVRCTHGSTTGRVDEEQIFYCQSRGMTRHEAVRMIVSGFFQQIFDRITIESVRESLGQAIRQRIRQYE